MQHGESALKAYSGHLTDDVTTAAFKRTVAIAKRLTPLKEAGTAVRKTKAAVEAAAAKAPVLLTL